MTISNTLEELTTQQLSRWSHLIRFAEQLRREGDSRTMLANPAEVRREPVGERNRKIARILARDGEGCCYCDKPLGEDMTLEHRIAKSNGGSDELDNLKLAHAGCNHSVGNLPPDMKDELAQRINETSRDAGAANNRPASNQ